MTSYSSRPHVVISEDDRQSRLDELLVSDCTSNTMKLQCTEADDVDLDELLRKRDDDASAGQSKYHCELSVFPSPISVSSPPPQSPTRSELDSNNNIHTDKAASTQSSPTANEATTEAVHGLDNSQAPLKKDVISSSPVTRSPILAREEDEDGGVGHWIMPTPAKPGDYLNNSIKKIPSKSILKKASSYGNFNGCIPLNDSSHSKQRKNAIIDSDAGTAIKIGKKKTSFLNMSMGSASSNRSENSDTSSYGFGLGLDLGDSSSPLHSPRDNRKISPVDEKLPPLPFSNSSDIALLSESSMDLSSKGSKKMDRTVSFTSVDVREYDRTVGENPSCRSGPPLSLDWSYAKKYEKPKSLDEYETEREGERVQSMQKLHVNKYRRKNLLSFNWDKSEEEMKSARKETKKIQRQRSLTLMMLPLHKVEEAFINVKGFVAKKRGKADTQEELKRVTSELSLSLGSP